MDKRDILNSYYYTFGSDPQFPYYRGWVEVRARSWSEAHEKFRAKFPDRNPGILNCAFFYDADQWARIDRSWWPSCERCHEVI